MNPSTSPMKAPRNRSYVTCGICRLKRLIICCNQRQNLLINLIHAYTHLIVKLIYLFYGILIYNLSTSWEKKDSNLRCFFVGDLQSLAFAARLLSLVLRWAATLIEYITISGGHIFCWNLNFPYNFR